jgi:UDP-glucose 4-epimerase
MTMRVLITGGLGYIGGRLSLALAEVGGFELRLATRRAPEAWPRWARAMEVVRADPADPSALDRLCRHADAVIHLAGANEHASAADPAQALLDTALGTLALLQAAERQGVQRFVYMSTAHVYGAPLVGRIDELTLPRPVHPYAITHRTAEDFVLAARDRGLIQGLVLRLSNGLGAPADPLIDRWTLAGNDLCRQAARDGRLVLQSSGLQQRDFIALSDVGRAVLHVLGLSAEGWGDGLFNLGGERSLSILRLAEIIAARSAIVLGAVPPIEHPPASPEARVPKLDYRIDRLKRTGFAPVAGLEDEIDRTLTLCRDAFGGQRRVLL